MRKQIAESWNGGIWPEAVVKRASSDHIRIAEKPMSVAFNFTALPPHDAFAAQPPKRVADTVTGPSFVGIRA